MHKSLRKTGELLLILALLFSITFTAFASVETGTGRTGNITISLSDEQSVGTTISLYRVADLAVDSTEIEFTLTEDFVESRANLSNLDNADALARSLSTYVKNNSLPGQTGTVGQDSCVTFEALELGLYLVIQNEAMPDGQIVSPFLISVPCQNAEGEWLYDIEVSPETKTSELTREFTYEDDQFIYSLILEGTVELPEITISEELSEKSDSELDSTEESRIEEKEETTDSSKSDDQSDEASNVPDCEDEEVPAEDSAALTVEQDENDETNALRTSPGDETEDTTDPDECKSDEVDQNSGSDNQTDDSEELTVDEITMTIIQLDQDNQSYRRLHEYTKEQEATDELLSLTALQFQFFCNGTALDVSDCTLTASIASKNTAADMYSNAEVFQEEAESGVVLSVLSSEDQQITKLENVLVTQTDETTPTMTVSLGADQVLAVAAFATANPSFTVQYYAYIDQVDTSGSNALTIIDTDNGGNGTGGNLPENGITPATTNLYLKESNGKYTVATNKNTVVPVYSAKEYQYIQAPNLIYFNRLYENGHYQLKEIWILKAGKNQNSTEKTDWDFYTNPSSLHFTNRSQSASSDTILIDEGTVIRLVFDTTNGSYDNSAIFYDYDITDGNFYKAASTTGGTYATQDAAGSNTVYAYTNQQGINSAGNYTGSGTKLAFGNQNTGTGLDSQTWNGNALNRSNNSSYGNGYKGCTFGLVTELDKDGKIQYASGVSAPDLFNEDTATGKTTFENQNLTFTRDGDTYTLSAVSGSDANVSNLDQFTHITSYGSGSSCNIFSNMFWPMDSASTFGKPGYDLKFGQYSIRNKRKFFGNSTGSFPTVDENITNDVDHNSYFGMQYSVKFKLTEDYIGPLEYYFFGDDDMWVFLDGKLVCDIGGVHSSVGEYVNLWDYIKKGTSGEHTLSFYYTERGASGSSCYMRFTLPSVSSLTPEQNTGTLRVEKEVGGPATGNEEFSFQIHFTDQEGNYLKDDYSYTRYSSDGTEIKTDVIIYDGGTFQLKNGEYIIVKYLPVGARYYVTEVDPDPDVYLTTVSTNNGAPITGRFTNGTIQKLSQETVRFVNQTFYELPASGGLGPKSFYIMGTLLFFGAAILLIVQMYRHKR